MVANRIFLDKKCIGLLLPLFLAGCSPQRFFYYPNRVLYVDPDRTELEHELVHFTSLNGKTLYALYFPTNQKPKGTVVHFHGNYGNISNHFPLATFLIPYGFNVLSFDYQGYGASEGKPTPRHFLEDGIAAVRYAQSRLPNRQAGLPAGQAGLPDSNMGVVVFGQSIGGATAIVVAAKEPLVKAAVIEAAFASYRGMTRAALKRSILTWIFYPIAPLFMSHDLDPVDFVKDISPRPVLFIHGDRDRVVPLSMSQQLFAAAREPKKLWVIPAADHLECRKVAGKAYEEEISGFFTKALQEKQ